ncbi:MAG: substrate-binding domain-containing protein [Planctomycetota bacterium]|jgi:ribose transport system substrate-binding protein/putative xylitol transport system substrate-binding protein|nr:substrate-binding domain-containing protein [Planctomycetota bacterium]
MKKTLLLVTLCCLCLGFTFAVSAGEKKASYNIALAVYGTKGEYVQMWINAMAEHPAVKSGLAKTTVFDGEYSHIRQDDQFNTIIAQKFDAAIFIPIDSTAGGATVKKSVEAGVPVVGSNGPVTSDLIVSYIGSDDVEAGYLVGKAVIKAMGGKGNVVILEGPVGQTGPMQRGEGMLKALAENPTVKVLESKTANWSRNEAMDLMQNWLVSHHDQINGIFGQNDEMALGALAAVKSAGIQPVIPSAGIDGISDAVRAVSRKEMLISVRQDAFTQSQGALDIALRHLIGPEYKPMSECWKLYPEMPWGDGTAKLYSVPWTIVSPDNADKFLEEER